MLATAAFVYSRFGFDGLLVRDDAVYAYSGQQLARGVPPYVSIFDLKLPLASFLAGLGAWLAGQARIDSLLGIRLVFFVIGCGAVAALYLMGRALLRSNRFGLLAAFLFLGFWGFGRHVASGPRPKTAFTLFEVLALWLTARQAWFWAGVAGSLAFLSWQPGIIYPAVTVLLALLQSASTPARLRHAALAVAGALTPLLLTVFYFIVTGALPEFLGDALLTLRSVEREQVAFAGRFLRISKAAFTGYQGYGYAILAGIVAVGIMFLWRLRASGGLARFLAGDRFAAFMLSFLFVCLWSLYDFQAYPDLYPFLPYVAIALAWPIFLAIEALADIGPGKPALSRLAFLLLCLALAGSAARNYARTADSTLLDQREWARKIEARYLSPEDDTLLTFGKPAALVLMERRNFSRHVIFSGGEHHFIEGRTGQSLKEWWRQQMCGQPAVVVMGPVRPLAIRQNFTTWLAQSGYEESNVGTWNIFVAPPEPFDCTSDVAPGTENRRQ